MRSSTSDRQALLAGATAVTDLAQHCGPGEPVGAVTARVSLRGSRMSPTRHRICRRTHKRQWIRIPGRGRSRTTSEAGRETFRTLARRVASHLRWNTPLLVFAIMLWPGLGDAAGQTIDPALKIRPRIAEAVKAQRQLPRTSKAADGVTLPLPRAKHVLVLTGTEGFNIDGFRSALTANGGPYNEHRTAQAVLQDIGSAGSIGVAGWMAYMAIGAVNLELNWAYATLLGDSIAADRFKSEASRLSETDLPPGVGQISGPPSTYDLFGTFSPSEAQVLARGLSLTLRGAAIIITGEAAGITDAIDPEGFVRQSLRSQREILVDVADSILDFAE